MNRLDDVAILVFPGDATGEGCIDAVVELAIELGLLEGRNPEVLRQFLSGPKGQTWLDKHLLDKHLISLRKPTSEEPASQDRIEID